MNILKKMTKLSAAIALAASFTTLPAVAQTSATAATALQVSSVSAQFRSRGRSFRGNRSSSRRSGFNRSRSSFNRGRSFNRNRSSFNRSRSSFNRGRSSFSRGNSFNRGFRGTSFNRGFSNRGFRRTGFIGSSFGVRTVVRAPVYAVGGFYGFGANSVFISDFGAFGLYAPPVGYRWVCDKGSNDCLLYTSPSPRDRG